MFTRPKRNEGGNDLSQPWGMVFRSTGVQVYWSTGVQVYWSTGVQVYWSTGLLVYAVTLVWLSCGV